MHISSNLSFLKSLRLRSLYTFAFFDKGIVRGQRSSTTNIKNNNGTATSTDNTVQSKCTFIKSWNMYKCTSIRYKMFVIESLDADTETRRLSPIGIASNG